MDDVGCRMSDVGCQITQCIIGGIEGFKGFFNSAGCLISDIRHPTSDIFSYLAKCLSAILF